MLKKKEEKSKKRCTAQCYTKCGQQTICYCHDGVSTTNKGLEAFITTGQSNPTSVESNRNFYF